MVDGECGCFRSQALPAFPQQGRVNKISSILACNGARAETGHSISKIAIQ